MPINAIGSGTGLQSLQNSLKVQGGDNNASGSFQQLLGDALGSLNKLQSEADSSAATLAAGGPVELHEVLLANERASIAFQLAVQVRNKIVDAYQQVMQMQV